MTKLSRRSLFTAAAAAAALAPAAIAMAPRAALAKAPAPKAQAPSFTHMRIGDAIVTAFLDGYVDIAPNMIIGYDAEAAKKLYRGVEKQQQSPRIPVNAYAVNTGGKLILVDAGSANSMGETLGGVPAALLAAGYAPEQVDAVLLTHAHPDHVNGIATPSGAARFPNAEIIVPAAETSFIYDEGAFNGLPEWLQPMILGVRKSLAAYKGRVRQVKNGEEALPNFITTALPGHTPGHSGYLFASGDASMLFMADAAHMASLQFTHPEWGIGFDLDPAQSAATRKKLFDQLAADKTLAAGVHMPFPGFGYIESAKQGYAYIPAHWDYAL